jgi:hypothetical protein
MRINDAAFESVMLRRPVHLRECYPSYSKFRPRAWLIYCQIAAALHNVIQACGGSYWIKSSTEIFAYCTPQEETVETAQLRADEMPCSLRRSTCRKPRVYSSCVMYYTRGRDCHLAEVPQWRVQRRKRGLKVASASTFCCVTLLCGLCATMRRERSIGRGWRVDLFRRQAIASQVPVNRSDLPAQRPGGGFATLIA